MAAPDTAGRIPVAQIGHGERDKATAVRRAKHEGVGHRIPLPGSPLSGIQLATRRGDCQGSFANAHPSVNGYDIHQLSKN